jgi:hypothetical protein
MKTEENKVKEVKEVKEKYLIALGGGLQVRVTNYTDGTSSQSEPFYNNYLDNYISECEYE